MACGAGSGAIPSTVGDGELDYAGPAAVATCLLVASPDHDDSNDVRGNQGEVVGERA